MVVAWLVFILSIIIFFAIGWTGIFHAKKFKIPGDYAELAVNIYVISMLSIIILVVLFVFINGANVPIVLPDFSSSIKGVTP